MHVDWHWIKQRPHFLAEGLAKLADVIVLCPYYRKRKNLVSNLTSIPIITMIHLPFKHYLFFLKLDDIIQKAFYLFIVWIFKPNILWITSPVVLRYLPTSILRHHQIVYDCMDDELSFQRPSASKTKIAQDERTLLQFAKTVIVTSESLRLKLISRGCDPEKLLLVRNAFGGTVLNDLDLNPVLTIGQRIIKVAYVGTVSEWLDFDALLYCLERNENIEFHFFGPCDDNPPVHRRLIFHGLVEHSCLYNEIKGYDCMIMPFKITNLIESVDPVKLYEYINFNKKIISVYYLEIARFEEFVYFYNNKEELLTLVSSIHHTPLKYSNDIRKNFLKNNSWQSRIDNIVRRLFNE